jgi:D-alanyl-D-alanine carboxypeptidase
VANDDAYFPPGSGVQYSNTNYLLLILVVEGATGRSHSELLRERILKPLDLANTVYHP